MYTLVASTWATYCRHTVTKHFQSPLYRSGTVFLSISHLLRHFPSSALSWRHTSSNCNYCCTHEVTLSFLWTRYCSYLPYATTLYSTTFLWTHYEHNTDSAPVITFLVSVHVLLSYTDWLNVDAPLLPLTVPWPSACYAVVLYRTD